MSYPRKNVLLITCIDLRLMDNITRFMDEQNLTNRYDQFVLAGASLGACLNQVPHTDRNHDVTLYEHPLVKVDPYKAYLHWEEALYNHLDIAIALHNIKDVYIIEHEDCGAYQQFLIHGDYQDRGDLKGELIAHKYYADELAKNIVRYVHQKFGNREIHTHTFMIDLKGTVHPF